jgi:hypothetical protein
LISPFLRIVLRRGLAALLFGTAALWSVENISQSKKKDSQKSLFREASSETGLNFWHFTGATGEYYFPENMGAGVALFDYDNDGDLDVYFAQGMMLDESRRPLFPPPSGWKPGNRLFRNLLSETGQLKFVDVTEKAGVGHSGYGMGIAVGDYDNDGYQDLYVTNFGHNVLYHNNGNGTFSDLTQQAHVDDPRWSTSAAFCDYDNDGYLDLFLTNYVDFTVKGNKICKNAMGLRDYCNPSVYQPVPARLLHNERNGTFKDVTEASGIGTAFGRGLGVACGDFNADGWIDFFVANDGSANQLWINQKNRTFRDAALLSGVAYNADGNAQAGMGVAAGDYLNSGNEDLFVTHLSSPQETPALYKNEGAGNFIDATRESGLGNVRTFTGFGTGWLDYDNDGYLDLFVADGAVYMIEDERGDPYPYHERNQLFHNERNGHLSETSLLAGPAFQISEVGRGAAFGDVDNNGTVDIVIANNDGPARLLLNQSGSRKHWLEVQPVGVSTNRYGLGSRVAVLRKGEKTLWRRAHTDGSYLSASDSRVHFGLGDNPRIDAVGVQWLGGRREIWTDVSADRIVTLRQGSGKLWSESDQK